MRHSHAATGTFLSSALTTGLLLAGATLGGGLIATPAQAFCDDGRVMGGCITSIDEFPWQVSLFRTGSGSQRGAHFCGGSVIDERWVLTAAHCIEDLLPTDPSPIAVYFGSTSLEDGGRIVDIQTIYAHPDYRGVGSDDIALLELASAINVPPVPLASAANARALEREGDDAVVTGWGNTPGQAEVSGTVGGKGGESTVQTLDVFETSALLLGAEVPIVDNARCDERGDPEAICAGYRRELIDACAGDSGGPLHAQTRNGYVQVGLVSGGTLCVDDGERFSTYTRVSAYEEWIRATMAGETQVADLRVFPDFSLPATFFDEEIITGFTPDPVNYPLQAGGYLVASDVVDGCAGFVAEAPDVRITYEAGSQYPLRVFVEGSADTTLLINQPDGEWLCNDDRVEGDLNPEIFFAQPLTGQYDIWVGTYENPDALGDFPQVNLLVSELER
ncbi:MAG: trypsin-like serine protease [Devosiaceae bacterium]